MTIKHTAGSWFMSGSRQKINGMDNHSICATVDGKEIIIASVWYNPKTHEGFHDAKLIAAASTMYDFIVKAAKSGDEEASILLDEIYAR